MLAKSFHVSMNSGLSDRNNRDNPICQNPAHLASMKSTLRDQNNGRSCELTGLKYWQVSMKSGLRDRNNPEETWEAWLERNMSQ